MTDDKKAPNTEIKRQLALGSAFFRDFSQETLEAMLPLLKETRFDADNVVCPKGEASDSLYLIREGEAEISVSSKDGKIIVLGTLRAGDVFGEIGLLDQGPRTANVTALTDMAVYKLGAKDFERVAANFSLQEWIGISRYICGMFRSVAGSLEATVFLDTHERILRRIVDLYDRAPAKDKPKDGTFEAHVSQEQLGRMTNLSREATNKALSRLGDMGLIERRYKHIFIPNIARVRELLRDDGEDA